MQLESKQMFQKKRKSYVKVKSIPQTFQSSFQQKDFIYGPHYSCKNSSTFYSVAQIAAPTLLIKKDIFNCKPCATFALTPNCSTLICCHLF